MGEAKALTKSTKARAGVGPGEPACSCLPFPRALRGYVRLCARPCRNAQPTQSGGAAAAEVLCDARTRSAHASAWCQQFSPHGLVISALCVDSSTAYCQHAVTAGNAGMSPTLLHRTNSPCPRRELSPRRTAPRPRTQVARTQWRPAGTSQSSAPCGAVRPASARLRTLRSLPRSTALPSSSSPG